MSEEIPPEEPGPRLPGVAYPLIALVFGGALVWSFSRILLAATGFTIRVGHTKVLSMDGKQTAVALALFMALNILVGSALIAYGRRVRSRPAAFPFLVVAGLALIGAGIVAAAVFGDHPEEAKAAASGPAPQTVTLTASGTKFLQTSLAFTAGAKVTVQFQNKDSGVQHNFALFQGKDASGAVIFRGDLVTGPGTAAYTFTAPPPGTYFFHCDVHPTVMFGTATVTAGGGGPPSGPLQLAAQNIAFSPAKLTASGPKVTIHFTNKDSGTPHNVAVFNGSDATAPAIFHGDLVTGPGSLDYTFTLPGPGTYFIHCDVHPTQMTGTITLGGPP